MIHALPQANLIQQPPRLRQAAAFHIQLIGQQHIFKRRECLDQLVGLEDEADLAPAHRGQFAQPGCESARRPARSRPELGVSRPASRPSSVLLPLPLAPTMATNCPAGIVSEIPFRISTRRAPF